MDTITGTFGHLIWASDDGGDIIARFQMGTADTQVMPPVFVTVIGPCPVGRTTGVTFRLHGEWTQHPQHGRQFRFAHAEHLRTSRVGVIAYLIATCPGVGHKRATALYDQFSGEAVDVLRHDPARVVEAGILTVAQANEASQALHDDGAHQATRIALLDLLASRGLQLDRVVRRCIQLWGRRAPEFLRARPYLLLLRSVPSCGWKRVDKLYCDLGHRRDALKRQALTILHHLLDRSTGDTWESAADVAQDLRRKIPTADPVRAMRLAERAKLIAIRREANGGKGRWLAPKKWAEAEATITRKIKELVAWMPTCLPTLPTRPTSIPTSSTSAPPSGNP